MTHVQPHGALNNMAHVEAEHAMAIGRGIKAADPSLIDVADVGSEMVRAGERLGRRIPGEIHTFCVHGDGPTAVPVKRAVRAALDADGIAVVPLPALLG